MTRSPKALLLAPLAAAALGLLAPSTAGAFGFYLTGGVGETSADTSLGDSFQRVIDGDDESWSAGIGLQLNSYVDFQLEYHDLGSAPGFGSPCPDGGACLAPVAPLTADTTALSLSVLPSISLSERVKLFGKLGVVTRESSVNALIDEAEQFVDDFDDEELLYGAGLRVQIFGPIDGFVQYQRFGDAFDEVAVGVTFGYD